MEKAYILLHPLLRRSLIGGFTTKSTLIAREVSGKACDSGMASGFKLLLISVLAKQEMFLNHMMSTIKSIVESMMDTEFFFSSFTYNGCRVLYIQ